MIRPLAIADLLQSLLYVAQVLAETHEGMRLLGLTDKKKEGVLGFLIFHSKSPWKYSVTGTHSGASTSGSSSPSTGLNNRHCETGPSSREPLCSFQKKRSPTFAIWFPLLAVRILVGGVSIKGGPHASKYRIRVTRVLAIVELLKVYLTGLSVHQHGK